MAEKKNAETNMSLGEVQAVIAEMLANARAEAEAIVADAKTAAADKEAENAKALDEAKAESLARGEEMVEIKLFKDTGKYREPVFVSCNGETIAIERGVRVKIKRKHAEILDHSDKQDYEAALYAEGKAKEFERDTKAYMGV